MANRFPVIVTNTGAGDSAPFAFKEIPSGDDLRLDGNFIRIGSTSAAQDVIKDANGNTVIRFPTAVASAVNYFQLSNSATGNSIVVEALGGDADVSIHLKPKGSNGEIIVGNSTATAVIESSGSQNLILRTGSSSPGTLTLAQGTNGDLTFAPNGSGKLKVGSNNVVVVGDSGVVSNSMIANSAVTFAKIENSAAAGLSVVGRSTNSAGVFAEINAGTDGHILRRAGTALGFGTIVTNGIGDDQVTYDKIQNVSATSRVLGRTSSGAGNIEELSITGSGNVVFSTSPTLTTPILGAATATSLRTGTGGIGYNAGGGTVTQSTNRTTAVTLNAICGTITLFSASAAANTTTTFTVNNNTVAAGDRIVFNHVSAGNLGAYNITANTAAGSFTCSVYTAVAQSAAAPVIGFAVIKATTSA